MTTTLTGYRSVRLVGSILPSEALTRAADGLLPGQKPAAYGLVGGLTITAAAARAWDLLLPAHTAWKESVDALAPGAAATRVTRERFLLPLLNELGYGRVPSLPGGIDLQPLVGEITPSHYPVSHQLNWSGDHGEWSALPVHLLGPEIELDRKTPNVSARAPHAMVQELLNRSDRHLYALVSNGRALRLLRDASSIGRQSFLEFDLEAMFENQLYADFRLLFTVLHASRLEPTQGSEDGGRRPETCWLEQWRELAISDGARALDALRDGVATALTALGTGFLAHPANDELRHTIENAPGAADDFHRWLLRIAYRLIVLFVAEDRQLLHPVGADPVAASFYEDYFSSARLRRLAGSHTGGRHGDLWESHKLVADALGGDGNEQLALAGLASSLYEPAAIGLLAGASLSNRHFLAAVRALSRVTDRQSGSLRPVDYRNLDSEELGGVYEGLLAYTPRVDPVAKTFTLQIAAGNERKKSGSYYTPSELITLVLDEALDPLIAEALAGPAAEETLLSLSVCDPACGSGHFLVAAARRIATAVAAIRAGDPEPGAEEVRRALRDVVGRCIYGVDLSDLAIEIAKVALWLETLDKGKPLAFLDAHLRVGNALLGATPVLVRRGIPDGAFAVLDGDDKAWATELKARNKKARTTEQTTLFDHAQLARADAPHLADRIREAEAPGDDTLAGARARADAWRKIELDPDLQHARLVADTWCAAFFQDKRLDRGAGITHQTLLRLAQDPVNVPAELADSVGRLARQYRFFHWHLEFPGVFSIPDRVDEGDLRTGWAGGFSCVIGNPPWERIKLQDKEFFSSVGRADIADAPNAARRTRMIEELTEYDAPLHARYVNAKRDAERASHFLRNSTRFPLCGKGDVNTYPVFAEHATVAVAPGGRVGVITPSGIATDSNTQEFFRSLVTAGRLRAFYDFLNNDRLFYGVGNRTFKFCVLVASGEGNPNAPISFGSFLAGRATLSDTGRRFQLTGAEIARINPNTRTAPLLRTRDDATILLGVHKRLPILRPDPGINAPDAGWGVNFQRQVDMATDAKLFVTKKDLLLAGGHAEAPDCMRALNGAEYTPLVEAKMFNNYNPRWGDYALRAEGSQDTELPRIPDATLDNPAFYNQPRYWVPRKVVEDRLDGRWTHDWLLAFRDVTKPYNERTIIPCLIPRYGVAHTAPLIQIERPTIQDALFLVAALSSFVADWTLRLRQGGTHLTYSYATQIPVPYRSRLDEECPWDRTTNLRDWVVPRAWELMYTGVQLAGAAVELDDERPPFRWDPARRELIVAELDAAMFHLYGLARSEVEHVMQNFHNVRGRDFERHEEFRTLNLILEQYDAMTATKVFVSRLDPLPGLGSRHG